MQVQSPASAGEPELGVDERHGDLLLTGSHILAPWSLLCAVRLLPDYCLSPRPLPELLATYQRGAGPWLAQAPCPLILSCATNNNWRSISTLYPAIINRNEMNTEDKIRWAQSHLEKNINFLMCIKNVLIYILNKIKVSKIHDCLLWYDKTIHFLNILVSRNFLQLEVRIYKQDPPGQCPDHS